MTLNDSSRYEYIVKEDQIKDFTENGFVVLRDVITSKEIDRYIGIVNDMLSGKISTKQKRGDLGGHADRVNNMVENTVQIVHPYSLTSLLDECELFRKGEDICNQLYEGDSGKIEKFGLDCSQVLVKFPQTATETPWHQDQSYYPSSLEDKRAANVWLALDECTVESGCLRFLPVPLSKKVLTPHRAAGNGKGALTCDPPMDPTRATCAPMKAGSVVVFNNYTYHYGGPNLTDKWRPAFVAQYRPKLMIQRCRELNFDHGKFANNEDGDARTKSRLKVSTET
jgi:ectoine hydroxylase-related dioxygenase (phytanoyl-CoA dioxygenase family)